MCMLSCSKDFFLVFRNDLLSLFLCVAVYKNHKCFTKQTHLNVYMHRYTYVYIYVCICAIFTYTYTYVSRDYTPLQIGYKKRRVREK